MKKLIDSFPGAETWSDVLGPPTAFWLVIVAACVGLWLSGR